MQREKGFTLIELLIVVAIIGILAAIAIPNLLSAMTRSRQKRTMADMRAVAMSWESRATETGNYTATGLAACCETTVSIEDMKKMLVPTFAKDPMADRDGWGRQLEFRVDTASKTSYQITSYGKDGVRESAPAGGGFAIPDCDLIFSNGMFVQYPDGVQTQ